MKLSTIQKQILEYSLKHPEDPNSKEIIKMCQDIKRKKQDPDLHKIAEAFKLMGDL